MLRTFEEPIDWLVGKSVEEKPPMICSAVIDFTFKLSFSGASSSNCQIGITSPYVVIQRREHYWKMTRLISSTERMIDLKRPTEKISL